MSQVRPRSEYERSDVPPRLLAVLAGGLALTVVLLLVGLSIAFPQSLSGNARGPLQPLPPAPQLEPDPYGHLTRYTADEKRALADYGWTSDGHVRVPVDQAMSRVAADGWRNAK